MISNGPIHTQTYSLTDLKPATAYETSVIARNVVGWSKPSAVFRFATAGKGKLIIDILDLSEV